MTIKEILKSTTITLNNIKIKSPHLEAEILLSNILNKTREYIFARPERGLTKNQISKFNSLIARRIKGEPIAYIIGRKQFYGLDFFVSKHVLIPRPESELMVNEALLHITPACHDCGNSGRHNMECITLIDIGAGSGCIIITLAKELVKKSCIVHQKSDFFATDISETAIAVARKNAKLHQVQKKIKFIQGNLLAPILNNPKYLKHLYNPKNHIIITANLPYLTPKQRKSSPSIRYEPKLALNAGPDGLKYYRQLLKQLAKLPLNSHIFAILEIDPSQTIKIKQLIKKELPNAKIQIKKDLAGHNRLVIINLVNKSHYNLALPLLSKHSRH